jgi:tetratricopeptide (TPR) repeat protein
MSKFLKSQVTGGAKGGLKRGAAFEPSPGRKAGDLNVMARSGSITVCLALVVCAGCRSAQEKEVEFLKRGRAQVAKKDYSRALLEFHNASNVMPRDAEPYYQTGLLYLETGGMAEALAAFRKATETDPKHAAAQTKLAELMTLSRDKAAMNQALAKLRNMLNASPDDPEISDYIAVAEMRGGSPEAALSRLDNILKTHPAHLQTAFALVQLKLNQKDVAGATQVLEEAAAASPKSVEALLALAQIYVYTKEADKAEATVHRALAVDAHNLNALAMLAAIQISQKKLVDAERTFRDISTLPSPAARSMHAVFLAQIGRREEAIAEFEKLYKQDPAAVRVRTRLIALYLDMNKTAEAQNLLNATLKKNADDIDALFQQSMVFFKQGDSAGAEKSLRKILTISPNAVRAQFALANLYRARGMAQQERQQLEDTLHLDANFLEARIELASVLLAAGETKLALDLLNQAPTSQANAIGIAIERNWALLATGDLKQLRDNLNRLLKFVRNTDLVLQDALLKFKEKDYAAARIDAEEVLRARPEDGRAALVLADAFGAQGNSTKGLERLAEAAAAHPKSAALQQLLGDWYANAGRLAEARTAFEAAKSDSNRFVEADIALARLDRREKQLEAARQRLTALLNADPNNLSALSLLAEVEEDAGNRLAAQVRYKQIVKLDPNNVIALNNLAYQLAAYDPDGALDMASKAATLAPNSAAVQDTLGWIFYRKGMYLPAEKYLKLAVEKAAPGEPAAQYQYHLARTYLKSGEETEGAKLLAAVLRKNPELAKTESGW